MLRVVAINASQPVYNEADAAEAITPGMIVSQTATGTLEANDTAGSSNVPVMVAVENDIFGKGIDDNWEVDDRVIYQHLRSGCEFHGLVASGDAGGAIAYDDPITTAAGGYLTKGTAANAIGYARSAVAAAPGADTRVRVAVI